MKWIHAKLTSVLQVRMRISDMYNECPSFSNNRDTISFTVSSLIEAETVSRHGAVGKFESIRRDLTEVLDNAV